MTRPAFSRRLRRGVLWIPLLLAGCATPPAPPSAPLLLDRDHPESILAQYEQASRNAPDNHEFRLRYLSVRSQVINRLLADADFERTQGHFDAASALYRRVQAVDRDNPPAQAGLFAVEQAQRHGRLLNEAGNLLAAGDPAQADGKLGEILRDDPQQAEALALRRQVDERMGRNDVMSPALRAAFRKPVSLEFRDTPLKQVLEALSKHVGLNFVLDKDVSGDLNVTVFLKQVSVGEALDVMLGTNQLRRRILNETTLLIYPDTTDKTGEHQDLVVRNFFLANAEAKQVANMLKTVLKAKNVFADDKLNLLIVRDTPEMIRLTERMVAIQDVPEPEVMLELEVLEIKRSRLMNLGIQFPDQLTLFPLPSVGDILTLRDLRPGNLRPGRVGASLADTVINLQDILNNANLLANPRIRTHNREKALIRIGDRVPVITSTATSTGFVSENVQYIDVGLKLEVEPTIYPNDEVSIKLALEVSSVTREIVSSSGTVSYQIGGRNASTVLRLKHGETQILGGLINDQDIQAANKVPGLGSLPVLGRLFSSDKDSKDKTELLLSITPRLVRGLAPPPRIPAEFWSGTENAPRLDTLTLSRRQVTLPVSAPPPAAPARTLLPPPPPVAPLLRWEVPSSVAVGNTFPVRLMVTSQTGLAGMPLRIAYDNTALEVVDVRPGSFMAQDHALVETRRRVDVGAGLIYVDQQRVASTGASGDGDLLEIEFRALKTATDSPLTVSPEAPVDGSAPAVPPQPAATRITIVP